VAFRILGKDGLKGILELIKEIVPTHHLRVGDAETPKCVDLAEIVLAELSFPLDEQMPMRPAVLLKFKLPAPTRCFTPKTSLTSGKHELAELGFAREITGKRVTRERVARKCQGDKPPLIERRETFPLNEPTFAKNPSSRKPIRRSIRTNVNIIGRLTGIADRADIRGAGFLHFPALNVVVQPIMAHASFRLGP